MIGAIGLVNTTFATGGSELARNAFGGASQSSGAAGASFSDLLASVAGKTVDSLKNAETLSVQGLQGSADTRQVADAVMNAEQSLQAAVAIRDKIVSAYLDISRMSI